MDSETRESVASVRDRSRYRSDFFASSTSELERFLKFQIKQNQVLELLAKGEPPKEVVDILLNNIESVVPGMFASALKLNRDGKTLSLCAAPSLPKEYCDLIENLEIGPTVGSCGTAAYTGKRVIVKDIMNDPLWKNYRDIAARYGFRACWSEPVLSTDQKVLGTFAMYYKEVRSPTPFELHVIESAAHLAGLELERRRTEKEARTLEKQLLQAQKMNAVGKLAGGIAHDLNNTLGAIDGHLQLIKFHEPELSEEVSNSIDLALEGCEKGANLIRQILGFSRQGKYQPTVIDIQGLVSETINFLSKVIRSGVNISLVEAPDSPLVNVDKIQIQQILTNLIINAQDAMPNGGDIYFEFATKKITNPKIYNEKAAPGSYCVLRVRDSGEGIAEENLEKIFEPFFTTKREGEGIGLGLSMAYGTMQHHGGWIEVDSTIGQGTVFSLFFPKHKNLAIVKEKTKVQTVSPNHVGHILVIDDELSLVELMSEFLERSGFRVTGFSDPKKAMIWYKTHFKEIYLTVLDMRMPGLHGSECFKIMKSCYNPTKVILISGYTRDGTVQKLLENGALAFFQKPMDFNDLTRWISDLLGHNLQKAV